MNLITKLGVLNSSKLPNQVLKTFTTTHKNHISLFYDADYTRHQNRSNSVPCRPVNSFGPIELLQRSVSPSPYLMRRAQISYMSNKLDLIKEWQKSVSKNSRTTLKERKFSTTFIKKDCRISSNYSVPHRRFSKLTDAIKNIFSKKSKPHEFPLDDEENAIPNMKMRIVPYSAGRPSTKLEIAQVDMEEQARLTPKIPYLYNYEQSKLDDHVRPMSNFKDIDGINKRVNALVKKSKSSDYKSKSKIVEVICPDVEDDVEELKTKKTKHVPFQNMMEEVIEPKAEKKSTAPIISVADMCKDIDKCDQSRRRKNTAVPGAKDRHVVSYPIIREVKQPLRKIKDKHFGKAKSTRADEVDYERNQRKIRMSNYWAKQKPRAASPLSKKSVKVEPCDPHKDSTRELSNVSYDKSNPNLTKLSYENYSIPSAAGTKSAEQNVFSLYERTDNVPLENIGELRKTQISLKVPKTHILSQTKALATSHVDVLNTQLLCSSLFASHSSKGFTEDLRPYQIKSYLALPNYDLSDLGILDLSLAQDKENRKVEWEKYKSAIYDLKSKEKAAFKGKHCSENTFEGNAGVVEESVSEKPKGEKSTIKKCEEQEQDSKRTKATTKTNDKEDSSSKPITFIKKDYHTNSCLEHYICRKLESEASAFAYSTKARSGGRRGVQKVIIPDKEKIQPDPCKISEIIKRAKMKQGKSLMKHTEWKAVPIRGMKNAVAEHTRIRDEREKYKELIKMRSNSRETKEPEKCILRTPFDEVEEPKPKPKRPKTSTCIDLPNPYECQNKIETKVIFTKSSNSTDDCACVTTGNRKPSFGNKIIDTRENLACVPKKCVQTEECKKKLRRIVHEMEESAERLKVYEKLKRKNKNYNENCDSIRSRKKRS